MNDNHGTRTDVDDFVLNAFKDDASKSFRSPKKSPPRSNNLTSHASFSHMKQIPSLDSSSTSSDGVKSLSLSYGSSNDSVKNVKSMPRLRSSQSLTCMMESGLADRAVSDATIMSYSHSRPSIRSTASVRSASSRSRSRRSERKKKKRNHGQSRHSTRSRSSSSQRTKRSKLSRSSASVVTNSSARSTSSILITKSERYAGENYVSGNESVLTTSDSSNLLPSMSVLSPDSSNLLPGYHSMKDTRYKKKKKSRRHKNKSFVPLEFPPAGPDDDFRVIILLLDHYTRKFELVHCYIDNDHALVKDLLYSIPRNATYKPLQTQTYLGLCRPTTGEEMINSFMTKEYDMQNNEVLIAIPKGSTADQCVYQAGPILKNEKLIHLIKEADTRWKLHEKKSSKKQKQFKHVIDSTNAAFTMLFPRKGRKRRIRFALRFILACFAVVQVFFYARVMHERVMRPIRVGEQLLEGEWRNQCGVLSVFPESLTGCRSVSLVVNRSDVMDGVQRLTLYDEGRDLVLWEMEGKGQTKNKNPTASTIHVDKKGRVIMQGSPAKVTAMSSDGIDYISPWPFEVTPSSLRKGWFGRMRG